MVLLDFFITATGKGTNSEANAADSYENYIHSCHAIQCLRFLVFLKCMSTPKMVRSAFGGARHLRKKNIAISFQPKNNTGCP